MDLAQLSCKELMDKLLAQMHESHRPQVTLPSVDPALLENLSPLELSSLLSDSFSSPPAPSAPLQSAPNESEIQATPAIRPPSPLNLTQKENETIDQNQQCTTLVIQNIPAEYTYGTLKQILDKTHANCYDIIFLPIRNATKENDGCAYVNFINHESLESFTSASSVSGDLQKKKFDFGISVFQGKQELIEAIRCHPVMSKRGRPRLYDTTTGVRALKEEKATFPPVPTPSLSKKKKAGISKCKNRKSFKPK